MRYTTFGRRTGLRVPHYALGTGNFGTGWGASAERDGTRAIHERFVEAGGNFVDPPSLAQLDVYLGALDIELGEEHFDRLTRVSTIDLGIPHEADSGALNGLAGGAATLVDGPAVLLA